MNNLNEHSSWFGKVAANLLEMGLMLFKKL